MELVDFEKDLQGREGITLLGNYILFKDYELFDESNGESVYFNNFDDVLDYKLNGETIRDIIKEKEDSTEIDEGGRGQGYSRPSRGGKLFGGKGSRSGGRAGEIKQPLPPAYINTLTSPRFKSVDKTSKAFGKNLMDADREFAGLIDENGFALEYTKGQKTSVQHLERKGAFSIHNHPVKQLSKDKRHMYFNAPSTPDIRNWALGNGKGTIVVSSGNRTMYKLTKGNRFKAKEFIKAMNSAKSTGAKNYDSDVDKFLKANQKKYGYKYNRNKF